MGLSLSRIKEEITKNRKGAVKSKAIEHQNRLRFHAQTTLTANNAQTTANFFAFVENLLPHDKFKMFKSLFRYPVSTNEITATCFDFLSRIFESNNSAFDYKFINAELKADWEDYRTNKLQEPSVWSTKGWEHFKTDINSVLVVDIAKEQGESNLPQPYFYWVGIENVLTYEIADNGTMEYFVFKNKDKIIVIDDISYRVFANDNNSIGTLEIENVHDLGFCPCKFFWDEPISIYEPDVKLSPLTKVLGSLDWLLFYHISKQHLDLYGSYPIYSGYEQNCDFSNEENGDYCDGGYLKNKQGFYKYDASGSLCQCPKCGNKRIVGVGSFVEIPIPNGTDQPDLRNPVQMLSVDKTSLDYNVSEEERLKENIINSVVGSNSEVTQKQALNEQQVKANFEAQSQVLKRIKKGFEDAQKFVDETICLLRYGENYISCSINYGTEFFLYDANELRQQYKTAIESGASQAELDALQNRIIVTEYRNNPSARERMALLSELEPYPNLTTNEVITLYEKNIINLEELKIKLNFATYVKRFERENINISEFGSATTYSKKIQAIKEALNTYAKEETLNN